MSSGNIMPGVARPATKKAKADDLAAPVEDDPLLLNQPDIWVTNILPFVGPGNFILVAGVGRHWKEMYNDYFSTIKEPIMVIPISNSEETASQVCNTTHRAVFLNVTTAEYWYTTTKGNNSRLADIWVCETVAEYGNLEVIKWARQHGFPWDKDTCYNAARNGHLDVLKYAHENGCPWNSWTCVGAAKHGHLDVLKYAHEQGCGWNIHVCYEAAKNGQLEVLKYAHKMGCPWNYSVCHTAASNGHLEVLKYAHDNGCSWNPTVCLAAAEYNGRSQVAKYIHEQMQL